MKTCNKCGETKDLAGFYARPRMRDGYSNQCRKCEIQQNRDYRSRPGVRDNLNEKARARGPRPAEQVRRHQLWTFYRITPEQYDAMLEAQGGKCAVEACGATEPGGRGNWHVDHDHSCCDSQRTCGKCIRGLLCARCNVMFGMARDNAAILLSGVDYLFGSNNAALSALGAIGQG